MSDTPMRLRTPDDDLVEPGDFTWYIGADDAVRTIRFRCPRAAPGSGTECGVPVRQPLPNGARWQWDGNVEAPTLTPSINCVGGCGWHGFVRAGRLVDA